MRLHELKKKTVNKGKMRVGRGTGSGHGKTSGRGQGGQGQRSGGGKGQSFEGGQTPLVRRLPKRGFKNRFRIEYAVVNIGDLVLFDEGAVVTKEALIETGLIRKNSGKVKILGNGDIDRVLTVKVSAFSEMARKKIEEAGGNTEVI